MTSHFMTHDEAVKTLATERYLLREMNDEQRRAFEEHYLACAECFEAVMLGSDFVHEIPNVSLPAPQPTFAEKLSRFFAPLMRPAPALAFALLVGLAGLNLYQASLVHKKDNTIADLKAPRQEFRFVVRGEARGDSGAQNVISVPRNAQLSIKVEFTPGEEYIPYRADILSQNDTVKYSLPLSVLPTDDSVSFSIPAEALGAGTYSLVIRRQSRGGESKDLQKQFVLKFSE